MKKKIAILGQGYVGLPLAVEFGKIQSTIGFDISVERINQLNKRIDKTNEVSADELKASELLVFSSHIEDLQGCDIFIVTVPTPIDQDKIPDLGPLKAVCETISKVITEGNVVIFESTVYPGATEEVCVPIIECNSSLKLNKDFFVGYSPERINPGDKENRVTSIVKVTSGSTPEIATEIDELYNSIIIAGTHKASSIKVAEAAKVIENTQRDLNIAAVNEFAKIFNTLGIDTEEVLIAAGTKWNFLPFRPGLVGGHCISVDPYYLTYKAQQVGYAPEVILAGRNINDGMASYVATELVKELAFREKVLYESKVLIMGITFKGNCPDVRNTKVVDIASELNSFKIDVDIYDPRADKQEVFREYGIELITGLKANQYDGIILAVEHTEFIELGAKNIRTLCKASGIIYDLKYILDNKDTDIRL